jgi:phosphoglucomutase
MVSFGTSGYRGSALDGTFTEAQILAITQAICDYRRANGTDGPLYLGKDTHAVSDPAQRTALEVLAANEVDTIIQHFADGFVITSSHNPPKDGGFKYNPPNGGRPDTDVTQWVQNRANELLRGKNAGVKRVPSASAMAAPTTHPDDFVLPYVRDPRNYLLTHGPVGRRGPRSAPEPVSCGTTGPCGRPTRTG